MKWIVTFVIAWSFSGAPVANAEVIEFPEEELATETVLPIFDKREVVKNRLVSTAKRIEVGLGFGLNLTEALYNNLNFGISATYHFDEVHGVNLTAIFVMDGLSDMGKDLRAGKGLSPGDTFDPSLAPHPENFLLGNYQFTAYYGKISLSKNYIMNLALYGLGGVGIVSFGDSTNFGANLGVGQKLYFSKDLAFRADLRLMAYRGPNPVDDKVPLSTGSASVKSSDLDETTFYHTYLSVGLVFMF